MKLELSNKERDLRESRDFDWEGNNAAFKCPMCGYVFIVSALIHKEGTPCPNPDCGKSHAYVKGGRKSNGRAWIEWPVEKEGA